MRVFKHGKKWRESPKPKPKRRRIKWRITCWTCDCEFGVTDDEYYETVESGMTESGRSVGTFTCPECDMFIMHELAERVNEKGEPVRRPRE